MQLLIYETAVPVSSVRHAKTCVESGVNYGFSKKINSVPLMAVELPFAAAEYAIVFAGDKESPMPAVILGMRDKENLYLDTVGSWQAKYVPAFVRRYPFVFSSSNDGKTFTLCIDEAFAGLNTEGRGQRLFNDEGKPSEFTDNVLKFVQEYQRQFQRTKMFCDKLKQLDLLEPMQAQVSLSTGERTSLSGFLAVDRKKLRALEADKLADLAKTDELELLYLHLYSLRNFTAVKDKLEGAKPNGAMKGELVTAET
jgi:SapC